MTRQKQSGVETHSKPRESGQPKLPMLTTDELRNLPKGSKIVSVTLPGQKPVVNRDD